LNKEPILLVGAGGHARACIDVIECEGRYIVGGLIGMAHEVGTRMLGYPVIGTDADLPTLVADFPNALVTVGQIKAPEPRIRLFGLMERSGYAMPVIVSPRAHVSRHATVGMGTIVMHGAIVNAGVVVGRNCIVNSQSLLEHDVVIADHCHIATAAAINSGVRIGSATFVGSNTSIRQLVTIGANCVIGMGQRIIVDCEPGTRMPPLKRPE